MAFRHCIACGTRTQGKDGGGFDLDGGCIQCAVEKSLSYDNHGPGYMHCDYPKAGLTRGNVIRACLSLNDGRRARSAGYGFGFVAWGAGLEDCLIEKCLVVVDSATSGNDTSGLMFVHHITGFAGQDDKTQIRNCLLRNCIAWAAADLPLVSNNLPGAKIEDVRYEANSYLSKSGDLRLLHGGNRYSSVTAWREASGQETRDGISTVGKTKVVSITIPTDYQLTQPRKLSTSPLFDCLGIRNR